MLRYVSRRLSESRVATAALRALRKIMRSEMKSSIADRLLNEKLRGNSGINERGARRVSWEGCCLHLRRRGSRDAEATQLLRRRAGIRAS